MDQQQRKALQRQKVREAIGILRGVEELFGIEDDPKGSNSGDDWRDWRDCVSAFERWFENESALY